MASAKYGRTDGHTDGRMDGQTDAGTDRQTDAGYFIVPLSGFFETGGGQKWRPGRAWDAITHFPAKIFVYICTIFALTRPLFILQF